LTRDVYWIDEDDLDLFQRKKKRRISRLREVLRKLEKTDLDEFIRKLEAEWGINEKTLRRYLNALEVIGEISIKNGMIIYNKPSH